MVALLSLIVLLPSCDKEEPIPAYLVIDHIDLETNSNRTEGSDAHDIVDAWVYVDNKFIGVFEMPAKVPVLYQGKHEVSIIAGIKKNGLSNERIIYPFYATYSEEIELEPAGEHEIFPVVTYRENIKFPWLEDFEDNSISLQQSGSNSTIDSMFIETDPLLVYDYDGVDERYSARADIDTGFQIFEFATIQLYDLPRGEDVYLEFNFKSDLELIAGIYPITGSVVQGVPIVNYFPSTEWKKAYVNLADDLNAAAYQGAQFRIFFAAMKNTHDPAKVYLDNIKLVHF